MPLSSPDHLNGTDDNADDIWDEQPPSDMTEMALTEELRQVQVQKCGLSLKYMYTKHMKPSCCVILSLISHQEQAGRVQTQLNEEELKNSKLLQQIARLEEQITVISQESDRKDEVEFSHLLHHRHKRGYVLSLFFFLFVLFVCQRAHGRTTVLIFMKLGGRL